MAESSIPFPFPSNIHISSSVTIRLTDGNYLLWKTQMESLLRSQKLLGFVTGDIPKPSPHIVTLNGNSVIEDPNPTYEAWICTDELIKSWIFGTLSDQVLDFVHSLSAATSCEIWLTLTENFNQRSLAREFELTRRLQALTLRGRDFATYCQDFRLVTDQLSAIGRPLEEKMKTFAFTNSLGREFDPISAVIQSRVTHSDPPPPFLECLAEIANFDSRLQTYEHPAAANPNMAFQTQRSGEFRSGSSNFRGRGAGFSRYSNYRGRNNYSTRGRGFSQQVNNNGWSRNSQQGNNRPTCQICGRDGHTAIKCYNRWDNAYQSDDAPQALAAFHTSDNTGKEWYPDSGASAHVTATTTNLQSSTPYNGPETVMVGNGEFLPISHVGSTSLATTTGSIPLNDVLVCPNIQKSLISISKLCLDYPCGVLFDANNVTVLDLSTQKVVATGPRRDGLYVLEPSVCKTFYAARQSLADINVWHSRLGHANAKMLQILQSNSLISASKQGTLTVCEHCQMSKSSKLPFSSSLLLSLEPLHRIHCDLWGPSPVVSVQGF